MKNWIYAALAAFLATGCAPHGGYTLTGEVPEAWEGKPVVLFTTDTRQAEAIDSTTVANGKFRLQGVLDAPRNCRVAVYLDPQDRTDRNLTVRKAIPSSTSRAVPPRPSGRLTVRPSNRWRRNANARSMNT